MMSNMKDVFISHIHEDDTGLAKVKDLVEKHGLTVRDGSINSDKPNNAKNDDYIMREIITPRIKWCSTMVVYVTPGTKDSEWVNREIEKAQQLEKRIVGVWANGHAGCEIPEALRDCADAMVGWDGGRIVDAITGQFEGRENIDGSLASPLNYARIKCQ
jgi:Icc-related predicted phosphoesterase